MRPLPIGSRGHFLTLCLLLAAPLAARAEAPAGPLPQAHGFYARGSLVNPTALPLDGPGFIKLFRSRSRWFGTNDLVNLIQDLAFQVRELHPDGERIQVGDLAAREGGKISGHSSHQNGLDADLSYFRMDHHEQAIDQEEGFIEEFVENGALTSNFDRERNWTYLTQLVATGRIQRMFVDPAIKRAYCERFVPAERETEIDSATIETLRRLRPYPNHADHVHIRLYCPASSTECVIQDEVPPGSGCNELLPSAFDPVSDEAMRREHDGI